MPSKGLMVVFGLVCAIGAVAIGTQAGVVGVIIWVGLCVFLGFLAYRNTVNDPKYQKAKQEEKEKKEEDQYHRSVRTGADKYVEQFYRDCSADGITDANRASDIEKMLLFAQRIGIEGSRQELISAFQKGQKIAENTAAEQKMAKLRGEENQILKDNTQYISYYGREKRIQICKDCIRLCDEVIEQCERQDKQITKGGNALYQNKGDWAVAGGIASGLAGPVAGLAAALNVQQNNLAIDASNKAVASMMFAMGGQVFKTKNAAKEKKEFWEKRLAKAQQSLVEDLPVDDLYNALNIELVKKERSETGAARIQARVSQRKPIKVFKDVDAVVDGSLSVEVRKKKEVLGKGTITFPYEGAGRSFIVDVVCKGTIPDPDQFTIRFKPNKLWAIERAKD